MKKEDKAKVVEELTERLRSSDTLLVADYRGLTMPQIDALRSRLIESGAKFSVVKNTLGRRAAEAAGAEALLTLLEGPSAIAFLEADGDMVAAAKALADTARDSKILAIRGGVLQGRPLTVDEVETLAKLPPVDVLRGQVLGAITAPLTTIVGLFTAPLQNLIGLIDARIEQLQEQGDTSAAEAPSAEAEAATAEEEPAAEAPTEETENQSTETGGEAEASVESETAGEAEVSVDEEEE
jgi:large subunit ribosomal protein L10